MQQIKEWFKKAVSKLVLPSITDQHNTVNLFLGVNKESQEYCCIKEKENDKNETKKVLCLTYKGYQKILEKLSQLESKPVQTAPKNDPNKLKGQEAVEILKTDLLDLYKKDMQSHEVSEKKGEGLLHLCLC